MRSYAEYMSDLEFRDDEAIPNKFRCRARIGRGGRLVYDRIPVMKLIP